MEVRYATNGKANAGLATGIIGTALGALNGMGGNGLLGGLFGGNNGVVYDNAVNRFELCQEQRIAELETEVKLRDANTYTDQKLLEVYKHFDHKIEHINGKLCEQAVWNTAQTGTISCMAQQIAALNGLTKLVIPGTSICPEMMPRYNSYTPPTTEAPANGT